MDFSKDVIAAFLRLCTSFICVCGMVDLCHFSSKDIPLFLGINYTIAHSRALHFPKFHKKLQPFLEHLMIILSCLQIDFVMYYLIKKILQKYFLSFV